MIHRSALRQPLSAVHLAVFVAVASALTACGSSDDGDACGVQTLAVVDVSPAAGSSVENLAVVHAFTLVAPPVAISAFAFAAGGSHTAGNPTPATLMFNVSTQGADTRYEAQPVVWSAAPGHVSMSVIGTFEAADGCAYAFPAPLFDYDLTAGAGGGGSGGGGGAGGSGGG